MTTKSGPISVADSDFLGGWGGGGGGKPEPALSTFYGQKGERFYRNGFM